MATINIYCTYKSKVTCVSKTFPPGNALRYHIWAHYIWGQRLYENQRKNRWWWSEMTIYSRKAAYWNELPRCSTWHGKLRFAFGGRSGKKLAKKLQNWDAENWDAVEPNQASGSSYWKNRNSIVHWIWAWELDVIKFMPTKTRYCALE